ncbi:hypothetical protein EYC84_010966 [Monilinia fructicola]|uniref:Uncharacterized protein n=1 Tax=Monilinia fructicola TaxID=38448 RepID=A0A5M9JC52_MONFR|nr:hypothetical protein EYC84_010966 [Monilinia fructicola]
MGSNNPEHSTTQHSTAHGIHKNGRSSGQFVDIIFIPLIAVLSCPVQCRLLIYPSLSPCNSKIRYLYATKITYDPSDSDARSSVPSVPIYTTTSTLCLRITSAECMPAFVSSLAAESHNPSV